MSLADAVAHLSPERWETANRLLVRKGLAEFAHERLIEPEETDKDQYVVRSDDGKTRYDFTAVRRAWTTGRSTPTRSPATATAPNSPSPPWTSSSN